MSFYNTARLSGRDLHLAIAQAQRQEDAILVIYRAAARPLSPSQVWRQCGNAGKRWPITSIRRAITTLTKRGALAQLDQQTDGLFGKPEHLWQVAA